VTAAPWSALVTWVDLAKKRLRLINKKSEKMTDGKIRAKKVKVKLEFCS
jgi:hypothetical protein